MGMLVNIGKAAKALGVHPEGRDQRGAPVYRSRTPGTDSGLHAEGGRMEDPPRDL